MKAIHDFIIHVDGAFKDSIESGEAKIYIDKRMSRDRAANRQGTIVNCPALKDDGVLKPGYEVIFDATILYRQIYRSVDQESVFLVDVKESNYRINPDLIVLYRENPTAEWKGYRDNLMVSKSVETQPETLGKGLIYNPAAGQRKPEKTAVVKFANAETTEWGLAAGDRIYLADNSGIPFYFPTGTLYWVRTKDVIAKA